MGAPPKYKLEKVAPGGSLIFPFEPHLRPRYQYNLLQMATLKCKKQHGLHFKIELTSDGFLVSRIEPANGEVGTPPNKKAPNRPTAKTRTAVPERSVLPLDVQDP